MIILEFAVIELTNSHVLDIFFIDRKYLSYMSC